jgi:hypothetical protein
MNAIADYLARLSGQLPRCGRRRILAEVRAHLLEAADADSRHGFDADLAARLAVERFGPPERVAIQFRAVRPRPRALLQRAAAVTLAGATMATLGTATVWAIEPGTTHRAPIVQSHHEHAQRSAAHR